jgi:2'-5' RNA ligase
MAEACGGKPAARNKIHLTLVFLGSIETAAVERARAAAATVRAAAFDLTLDRAGSFRRAQVGWAGCNVTAQPLLELARTLGDALEREGFKPEERAFAPHVTLARRIRRPVEGAAIAPVSWRAQSFALVHSNEGRYETIASWDLD